MPIQAWERCLEYNDNRSLVTVEENGRGIKFINNKRKKSRTISGRWLYSYRRYKM
ncbi:hypothetical protein SAMN05192569_10962 [Parageobacillus thermantarcticus]|uniref:Uncharacterized protein n=1 Tax=Parageobacillus thermantarcticus TaxID=186116 RepID=A0A1I0U0S2_9BACL|nr:hypothetical protein SAMN05192569_10962 [Parageobacillus thermantarcticus]